MASSSTKIDLSESSGLSLFKGRANRVRDRGMPNSCRCRERALIKTSRTIKNPGRLFYCCPKGSEKDNYHLFKWTYETLVEDVEDLKVSTVTLEVDVKTSKKEIEDLKKMLGGYEQVFKALKGKIHGCEKEIKEIRGEIRLLKTMIVCGVVVAAGYCIFWT